MRRRRLLLSNSTVSKEIFEGLGGGGEGERDGGRSCEGGVGGEGQDARGGQGGGGVATGLRRKGCRLGMGAAVATAVATAGAAAGAAAAAAAGRAEPA